MIPMKSQPSHPETISNGIWTSFILSFMKYIRQMALTSVTIFTIIIITVCLCTLWSQSTSPEWTVLGVLHESIHTNRWPRVSMAHEQPERRREWDIWEQQRGGAIRKRALCLHQHSPLAPRRWCYLLVLHQCTDCKSPFPFPSIPADSHLLPL